jgi:putative tricarboxylic transport membrane protein
MTVRAVSLGFIAAWLVLGLYFVVQGIGLQLGSISSPSTGFMPFIIGIILIIFSIASAVPLVLSPEKSNQTPLRIERFRDPAIVAVSMIVYALVLERLGFVASTFVLIVFLAKLVGGTTIVRSVILGGLATAACYLVFGVLLGVRLP